MTKKNCVITAVGIVLLMAAALGLNYLRQFLVTGFSEGVQAPEGPFVAYFGALSDRGIFFQKRTHYEISVEQDYADGSYVLFEQSIDPKLALKDLSKKHASDVISWKDPHTVSFDVLPIPIVIDVTPLVVSNAM